MIAYFAWSAATTNRWNSFDWRMFLARIYSLTARILCWSIATGQLTLELQAREDASVRDLFFHPNGDWLLASIAYRDGRGTVRCFHSPRVVQ